MNQQEFEELLGAFKAHEEEILGHKGEEYATEEDRLKNFREIAQFLDVSMSEVALNYMLKHVQSIAQAVRSGSVEWCWQDENGNEGLKQRIADARNYLPLLAACIEEEYGNGKNV